MPEPAERSHADRVKVALLVVATVFLTLVSYWPALDGEPLFDDIPLLANQDCWRGLDRIFPMFSFGGSNACTYRPVRYVTFALDHFLAGYDPTFLHISNVIYHLLVFMAVFAIFRRWGSAVAAGIMAGIWSLHPVMSDAVAYISGRRDIVSTLFFVLALLALVRPSGRPLRWWHGLLALLCFLLAIGAKEMAVTLPAVWVWWVVVERWGRRSRPTARELEQPRDQVRPSAGRNLEPVSTVTIEDHTGPESSATCGPEKPATDELKHLADIGSEQAATGGSGHHEKRGSSHGWILLAIVLGAAALAFVLYRGVFDSRSAMAGRWWGGNATSNFATSFALIAHYTRLIVWPVELIGDYFPVTIPLARNFLDLRTLVGVLMVLGILAVIAVSLHHRWKATAIGLGWFLLTLLPVLHVFPHHELFAEHYLYLPLIGLAGALVPAVGHLLEAGGRARRILWLAVGLIVLAMVGRTHLRSYDWQNELVFNSSAHENAPDNVRVRYVLGSLLTELEQCPEAMPHLQAVTGSPASTTTMWREAWMARLQCSVLLGDPAGAEQAGRELGETGVRDARLYYWRGRGHVEQGRLDPGIGDLKRAVYASRGGFQSAVRGLIAALNLSGRYSAALAIAERYPRDEAFFCEQEILSLTGLGPAAGERAGERFRECLGRFPDSLLLLEWQALMSVAVGDEEQAGYAIRRLQELGAASEVFERIEARRRGLRGGLPAYP